MDIADQAPTTSNSLSSVVLIGQNDPKKEIADAAEEILKGIATNAMSLTEKVKALTQQLKKSDDLKTEKGLSFLEMRNMMLLSYLMDVASVVSTKSNEQSIQDLPAITRIVESRTVIEKMKPIHFKLKYLIDKLVKATTVTASDNVMYLKPNPGNIELIDVDDLEDQEASEKIEKKYVPPKVSAVHYDGDEDVPVEKKKAKMIEKAKRRAMSSSLMQELRNEFDDTPEEISEVSVGRRKVNAKRLEVEAYEEDNFVRLNPTKKTNKKRDDGLLTMSSLADNVTKFGDISALDASFGGEADEGGKRKKKRSSYGGKGKKKNVSVKRKYMKRK